MPAVRLWPVTARAALIAAAVILALLLPGALSGPARAGTAASAGTAARDGAAVPAVAGGCHHVFQPPDSWTVVCGSGGGTGGGPGAGGGGAGGGKYTCTLTKLGPAEIADEGLPKAPKGEYWAAITCPGKQAFGGVTLVAANGKPAVTPEELLQVAESELTVPPLKPATAPGLGHDGLVGLPEWYWIPNPRAQWRTIHVFVGAGPVWARLWATPYLTTFDPGGGLSGGSCNGPGAAYSASASSQAACTFTYDQSSATQQGGAYAAAVTVHWKVQWLGSDGNNAVINPDLAVSYPFALRVAEGQALVSGSGQ